MALLRLLCFPSTASLLTPKSLLSLEKRQQGTLCLSTTSSSVFCYTLPIKTRRPTTSLFTFRLSSSSSSSATVNIESQEVESQTEEDEVEDTSKTRLIAQNVPWTSTADDIRALFEKHGTVLDVELSMHNKKRNRGLAFVTMGSPEEALAALTNLEAYEYEGRSLKLNYATPKKKPSPPLEPKPVSAYNLFVANLSFEARAKDLRKFFDTGSAKVYSAEVIFHDNPRRSSGYGFVSFSSKEDADTALSAFQGKMLMGRPIRVARSKIFLRHEKRASDQLDISTAKEDEIQETDDASMSKDDETQETDNADEI